MATLSIVATVEAAHNPPRVKLVISDTGGPAITDVTVTRLNPVTGRTSVVRTYDGEALHLLVEGTGRAATLYDYEMPYQVAVTYSTVEQPAVTATVTVDESRTWLVHSGVPELSVPVEFRIGSFDVEERPANAGVFNPMGRRNSIVVTDGQRKSPRSSFTVATETLDELNDLLALVDDAGALLLNPAALNMLGLEACYIAVQDVRVRRLSNVGSDPQRDVELPYIVVDAPVGGSQSQLTWADVIAEYATWADLMAARPTWAHVLAPTD